MYKVAEKFVSINGEGTRAGQPAVFIRFTGCNLNCGYCDTKWANVPDAKYEEMSADEIMSYIRSTGITNVTVTGGEPLLQKNLAQLMKMLAEDKMLYTEIETNGAVDVSEVISIGTNRPSLTMDYKLPSSGMEKLMCMDNLHRLEKIDTVKFVAGTADDLNRALEIIDVYKLIGKCAVYFSPVFGSIEPCEIVDFILEHKLNGVNMQLQMHKFIWDPNKRGV